jgi:hypothetical protein
MPGAGRRLSCHAGACRPNIPSFTVARPSRRLCRRVPCAIPEAAHAHTRQPQAGRPAHLGVRAALRTHCHVVAVERYRPAVVAKYRRNLHDSRRRDFVRRAVAFLVAHRVRVVRVHTAGDYYSARYARK